MTERPDLRLLEVPETPAFIYDETRLHFLFDRLKHIRARSGCRILYSVKALPFAGVLRIAADRVDGLSVSSLFEARLANEILAGRGSIHITTPGLRADEINEIGSLCDFVSFNSLPQWQHLGPRIAGPASLGLRINPQRSHVDDARYDPCRTHSKLGVPLPQAEAAHTAGAFDKTLEGLHFHNACESLSFAPLYATVRHIERRLGAWLATLRWINLGGGYLLERPQAITGLCRVVDHLHDHWNVDVYFEPGKAVVGRAGYLVASVIDQFDSGGKTVAILDTSVNHHPEVFEYQRRPTLAGDRPDAPWPVVLAGSTCLSGDLFGEYRLPKPLQVGDRVIFENVGAYSLIKAHRFNGLNLPSIHALTLDGQLREMKRYDYEDYRRQWLEDPG